MVKQYRENSDFRLIESQNELGKNRFGNRYRIIALKVLKLNLEMNNILLILMVMCLR